MSRGSGELRRCATVVLGSARVGLDWHGHQLDGDDPLHAFGLFVDWGFFQ